MALHPLAFGLLFYALMLLSMVEMFRMTGNSDITSQKATVYVIATVLYGMSILVANHLLPAWSLISILLFLPVFFIVELFRKKPDTIGNVNIFLKCPAFKQWLWRVLKEPSERKRLGNFTDSRFLA